MRTEAQFNTWLRKGFHEETGGNCVIERVESTVGNGIFDLFVILPHKVLFIESKYETTKLRSEQYALQIKASTVVENNVCRVMSISVYPKTKRFVVNTYCTLSITEDGIKPTSTTSYKLSKEGFKLFYNQL